MHLRRQREREKEKELTEYKKFDFNTRKFPKI